MRIPLQISAAKNYFLGLATSGAIMLGGLFYFKSAQAEELPPDSLETVTYTKSQKIALTEFNPNDLSETEWLNLGFSERQVATILKYKNVVGGEFVSKEQLKKCYSISEEKFLELEPYILLPEKSSSTSFRGFKSHSPKNGSNYQYRTPEKKTLKIPGKFNPDLFTTRDFVKMGFTDNQANSILKYKNYLGGSFISKEKFKDCFIISEENYRRMEPFLLLPDKTPENFSVKNNFRSNSPEKPKIAYQNFDPNLTDLEGWQKLGFSEKQAQVIINYRDRNLRGSFKNLEDIARCFVISDEKFEEMKPYIQLNPENFKTNSSKKNFSESAITKTTDATESKTDFSKVDINQISFKQLMEFGFDEKSAAMMLSYRKKLGGFVTRQQVIDTYDIDKNLAQKLISTAFIDDSKVAKYTLSDAPEEWLKTHPYFKYSADKIIYHRITNREDRKIWKLIKVKPEYEARMRLYLR